MQMLVLMIWSLHGGILKAGMQRLVFTKQWIKLGPERHLCLNAALQTHHYQTSPSL